MRALEHLETYYDRMIFLFYQTKHFMEKIKEKQLFIIDGYRIWAYTYEEAYQNYLQILKF